MIYRLVTGPTVEPITLQEAKDHLRVTESPAEDSVIESMLASARGLVEEMTRQKIITQTWRLDLPEFPVRTTHNPYAAIDLPLPPLSDVTSIAYTDASGNPQTVATSVYVVEPSDLSLVDPAPGRVMLKSGQVWPTVRTEDPTAVQITFECGHGTGPESVPSATRAALFMILSDLNENRESQIVGTIVAQNPRLADLLRLPRVVFA